MDICEMPISLIESSVRTSDVRHVRNESIIQSTTRRSFTNIMSGRWNRATYIIYAGFIRLRARLVFCASSVSRSICMRWWIWNSTILIVVIIRKIGYSRTWRMTGSIYLIINFLLKKKMKNTSCIESRYLTCMR